MDITTKEDDTDTKKPENTGFLNIIDSLNNVKRQVSFLQRHTT